jgi:hypothetical protein
MEKIVGSGRVLFAICIIAPCADNLVCAYVKESHLPVLPWLPPHPVLAYVTGIFFMLRAVAIATGIQMRVAGILLAIFPACDEPWGPVALPGAFLSTIVCWPTPRYFVREWYTFANLHNQRRKPCPRGSDSDRKQESPPY